MVSGRPTTAGALWAGRPLTDNGFFTTKALRTQPTVGALGENATEVHFVLSPFASLRLRAFALCRFRPSSFVIRLSSLMLLALVVLLAFAPRVLAHAELLEATPEPGANFRWSRPGEVRLRFSQQLDDEATSIRLINSRTFAEVAVSESTIDPGDPYVAVATLPDVEPGLYTVAWKTKSVDGHTLEGSYEFNVSPREPVVTLAVATVVLTFMGLLVFTRRAGPDDLTE